MRIKSVKPLPDIQFHMRAELVALERKLTRELTSALADARKMDAVELAFQLGEVRKQLTTVYFAQLASEAPVRQAVFPVRKANPAPETAPANNRIDVLG